MPNTTIPADAVDRVQRLQLRRLRRVARRAAELKKLLAEAAVDAAAWRMKLVDSAGVALAEALADLIDEIHD